MLSRLLYALRCRLHRPDVIVDVLHENGLLFIVLENIGTGPAEHVSVTFKPDLHALRGTVPLSELALFQDLPFFPPGKSVRAFLDVGPAYFERKAPTRFTTTVRFQSEHGASFRRTSTHDLVVYEQLGFVVRSDSRPAGPPTPPHPSSPSR
jgi:hypothetical protein